MAAVSEPDGPVQDAVVAPENPLGESAGQLMLTAPVAYAQLHAELAAAVPDIATVLRHPVDGEAVCSPENPAWLSFAPAATAVVKKVVKAHVPAPAGDPSPVIPGGRLASGLAGVREKLAAGGTLSPEEMSAAIALLLGVTPPDPHQQ